MTTCSLTTTTGVSCVDNWLVVPNDSARNCIGGCLHDVCVNVARATKEFNETEVLEAKGH